MFWWIRRPGRGPEVRSGYVTALSEDQAWARVELAITLDDEDRTMPVQTLHVDRLKSENPIISRCPKCFARTYDGICQNYGCEGSRPV